MPIIASLDVPVGSSSETTAKSICPNTASPETQGAHTSEELLERNEDDGFQISDDLNISNLSSLLAKIECDANALELCSEAEVETDTHRDLGRIDISPEKMIRRSSILLAATHTLCREYRRELDKSKFTNAKKDFFADYVDKLALFLTRHHSWLVLLYGKTSKKKRPRSSSRPRDSSPPESVVEGDTTKGLLPEAAPAQEVSVQVSPRSLSHPSSSNKRKKAKGGTTGDSQDREVQPKGDSQAESPP